MKTALVIGAGPAGFMAADRLSAAGHTVIVAEAKPSVARKLLMAGKSGLNLTKAEPFDHFVSAYSEASDALRPMLTVFGPDQVREWAGTLRQSLFVGTSGRVFPKAMKASPLTRAWLKVLAEQGVDIRTRWRWTGWQDGAVFQTPTGTQVIQADVTVLACGGASWARLGSDGAWADWMPAQSTSPFQPANMGFLVNWSSHMERHFGRPVKNLAFCTGGARHRGECVVSNRGLEGGGIYNVSRAMRDGAPLFLDLLPDMKEAQIRKRLTKSRGKASLSNHLRKTLRLGPVKQALLMEFARPLPDDLAPILKALPVSHTGPRPIDEAISTAGGLRFEALSENLMLNAMPGVFAAGEMLDWEAPTGGYLLTACLSTGRWAGDAAVTFLAEMA